jgi:hypothetical protein
MYIVYSDFNTGGIRKTPYNTIVFKIPNINWNIFSDLCNEEKENIDWEQMIIPTRNVSNDSVENLGSYLFDYRFGFDPNSNACYGCCGNDYAIDVYDELKLNTFENEKVLYCDHTKNQIIKILKEYFEEGKQTNYIVLYSENYDCGRYHRNAIHEEYGCDDEGNNTRIKLLKSDNETGFVKPNTLYQLCLDKVRKQFFSDQIELDNIPFDILYDL